ncbi:invasion associated locus B family protein [Martelella endophytica]|nr:invasion associated locus B family protein [Martelella endophytica]
MKFRLFAMAAASAVLSLAPMSAALAELPEGASSINEDYQDWRVACVSVDNNDRCSMLHNQVAKDSGQRVLSIELTAPTADGLQGIVLMPFGLALANGVTLNIDTATDGPKFGFSTCLPQGCIAPIRFDAAMIDKLKNGGALNITATVVDSGEPINITASLKGFTAAYNRLNALR